MATLDWSRHSSKASFINSCWQCSATRIIHENPRSKHEKVAPASLLWHHCSIALLTALLSDNKSFSLQFFPKISFEIFVCFSSTFMFCQSKSLHRKGLQKKFNSLNHTVGCKRVNIPDICCDIIAFELKGVAIYYRTELPNAFCCDLIYFYNCEWCIIF